MKRLRIGCLTVATLFVLACAGLFLTPSHARRRLPWEATDVHEHYEDARFGHDFVRCLKARVSHEGFLVFARRLNLTEQYSPEKHRWLHSWSVRTEPWWNPPPSLEGAVGAGIGQHDVRHGEVPGRVFVLFGVV